MIWNKIIQLNKINKISETNKNINDIKYLEKAITLLDNFDFFSLLPYLRLFIMFKSSLN